VLKGNKVKIPRMQEIIITKKLQFDEVIEGLKKDGIKLNNPPKKLEKVSKIASYWYEAKISDPVIRNVLLMHHPRCNLSFLPRLLTHLYNNSELVPKCGATVEETYKKLKKFEKHFVQRRSKCIQKIKNFSDKNFGHVVLTHIPITLFHRHKKLVWNSTSLIHFDGSHRLLSLYYPEKTHFDYIDCFLASNDENLEILNLISNLQR